MNDAPPAFDRLFGAGPGPPAPDSRLERLYDAVREVRAGKTPSSWTPAERKLFSMLPEAREK